MASYQIPQFLDSGEKILGPMNMRQFGYAVVGAMVSGILFNVIISIIPELGTFAIIFVAPIFLFFLFLALGKFNGRDSEVYVFKFIIYMLKPRLMMYQRQPDFDDINKKMHDWSPERIKKRWQESAGLETKNSKDELHNFNDKGAQVKANKIRNLGNALDTNYINTMTAIQQKTLKIQSNEDIITKLEATQKKRRKLF